MYTIIPTFIIVAIFAATLLGCGTKSEQSSLSPQATEESSKAQEHLGKVKVDPPPVKKGSLTNAATPAEPSSLLNADPVEVREVEPSSANALGVKRLALSREIRNREPVEAGLIFEPRDEKIFAFAELINRDAEARSVFVTFRHESGHTAGHVELEIPAHSARWRTWAYSRNVQLPGRWTLVLEDQSGITLDAVDFELMDLTGSF